MRYVKNGKQRGDAEMWVAISIVLTVFIICATVVIFTILENGDNLAYWVTKKDLKEIKKMLSELTEKKDRQN